MGFFRRRLGGMGDQSGGVAVAEPTRIYELVLIESEFDTDADDGTRLAGKGYVLRDQENVQLRYDDPMLEEIPAWVVKVAGVSYRKEALQDDAFEPGNRLRLIPEPQNPYDSNAIGIWDDAGRNQIGYVPRDKASEISSLLKQVGNLDALSLWEWRKEDGERCALKVIIGKIRSLVGGPG